MVTPRRTLAQLLGIASERIDILSALTPEWYPEGLCAQTDPEAFFPEKGGSTREAKKVCLACPVREVCLEHAITTDERHGVWGGLSERERRGITRALRAGAA